MLLYAKNATILHGNVLMSMQGTSTFIITLWKITEVAAHIYMLTATWSNRQITDINGSAANVVTSSIMTDYSKGRFLSILVSIFPGQIKLRILCVICKEKKYIYTAKALGSSRSNHHIVNKISFSQKWKNVQMTSHLKYISCYQNVGRSCAQIFHIGIMHFSTSTAP